MGHACASGASAVVMSVLFPDGAQLSATTANAAGTPTFDAGIHTQYDVSQGLTLGGQVGQEVAARASKDGANDEAVDFVKGPPEGRGADDRFLSCRPAKTQATKNDGLRHG
jgi:hypothetical protein